MVKVLPVFALQWTPTASECCTCWMLLSMKLRWRSWNLPSQGKTETGSSTVGTAKNSSRHIDDQGSPVNSRMFVVNTIQYSIVELLCSSSRLTKRSTVNLNTVRLRRDAAKEQSPAAQLRFTDKRCGTYVAIVYQAAGCRCYCSTLKGLVLSETATRAHVMSENLRLHSTASDLELPAGV